MHKQHVSGQLIHVTRLQMGRIDPAQGNRKLMEADEPPAALPVELAKLKLSMLSKEACCYDIPVAAEPVRLVRFWPDHFSRRKVNVKTNC